MDGRTDGRTDGRMDECTGIVMYRVTCTRLKMAPASSLPVDKVVLHIAVKRFLKSINDQNSSQTLSFSSS